MTYHALSELPDHVYPEEKDGKVCLVCTRCGGTDVLDGGSSIEAVIKHAHRNHTACQKVDLEG
jgi:hypothetical protein